MGSSRLLAPWFVTNCHPLRQRFCLFILILISIASTLAMPPAQIRFSFWIVPSVLMPTKASTVMNPGSIERGNRCFASNGYRVNGGGRFGATDGGKDRVGEAGFQEIHREAPESVKLFFA